MTAKEKEEYCNSRLHCDEGDCIYCMGCYDSETYELITFCTCEFDVDDEASLEKESKK